MKFDINLSENLFDEVRRIANLTDHQILGKCMVCGGAILPLADHTVEPLCDVCFSWSKYAEERLRKDWLIHNLVRFTEVRAREMQIMQQSD